MREMPELPEVPPAVGRKLAVLRRV